MGTFDVVHFQPPPPPLKGLSARLSEFYGPRFLNNQPPETDWLLKPSLARGDVGLLAGPPGVGKGRLIYQLIVHLCAGLDFLGWQIESESLCRALYLTAEENQNVVHRRTRAALFQLPEERRNDSALGLHCISVSGDVSLATTDKNSRVLPSENFFGLDELLDDLSPQILVLDTFARYFPVCENDNAALTAAFSLLEKLAAKYQTTILVTHHCSKIGSVFADSAASLKANLGLQSIRGGTAISGCVRWAAMLTPLTAGYAGKLFGDAAGEKPDGTFAAGRVVKKNEGPGEDIFYLKHGADGFEQVQPAGQDSDLSDAEILAAEVRRREEAGEAPLAATAGGRDAFLWGIPRSKKADEKAIADRLLFVRKRFGGNGNILITTSTGISSLPLVTG
jgi:phage-related protein